MIVCLSLELGGDDVWEGIGICTVLWSVFDTCICICSGVGGSDMGCE